MPVAQAGGGGKVTRWRSEAVYSLHSPVIKQNCLSGKAIKTGYPSLLFPQHLPFCPRLQGSDPKNCLMCGCFPQAPVASIRVFLSADPETKFEAYLKRLKETPQGE